MKQNIIWIASYPKSGNTMVRSFLSAYFFTKDGILNDFSPLKNIISFNAFNNFSHINNFPNIEFFKKNPEIISEYWKINQEKINLKFKNEFIFYKTHNALVKHNNNYFTNNKFTKCFIYIVRDPRSIVLSSKEHYGFKDIKESIDVLLSDKWLSYATETPKMLPEVIMSWKTNFLSWQNFYAKNKNKGLIIRYEDLVMNPNQTFMLILEFLANRLKISISLKKFENSIKSIDFKKLKKIEMHHGFDEKSKKTKYFFRKGEIQEWKNNLDKNLLDKIKKNLSKEMEYLNYF